MFFTMCLIIVVLYIISVPISYYLYDKIKNFLNFILLTYATLLIPTIVTTVFAFLFENSDIDSDIDSMNLYTIGGVCIFAQHIIYAVLLIRNERQWFDDMDILTRIISPFIAFILVVFLIIYIAGSLLLSFWIINIATE